MFQAITSPIPFWKMNGAGNDFIIIDHRRPCIAYEQMPEFARRVCRRKFSVGADGLFLLEDSKHADLKWFFFNADGSEAAMCGNGARCVARFAFMQKMAAAQMHIETLAGIIKATVAGTQATIHMTPPHSFHLDRQIDLAGQKFIVHSVDTGVPHAVLFVDAVDAIDLVLLGPQIRRHPVFGHAGTNVNFVAQTAKGLQIRTYERGVENETMACGTGVVAAALIALAKGLTRSPVTIQTTGGTNLTVQCDEISDATLQVLLTGPTQLVYKGELTAEALTKENNHATI